MLACAGSRCAGTHAPPILVTGQSRPARMYALVNVAGGIGLPFSVLFLLRVIVQIL